jgi:putative tryptophan/tyrosine transport system substrate-binding protein
MNPVRRSLIATLAAVGLAPALGRAQATRRIAWFGVGLPETVGPYLDALRAGLRDLGWEEGRNLVIQRFNSTRAPEDFESIVREIVESRPEVVVTQEFATLAMLRHGGGTTPVVFGFSGDPVDAKLVKSLSHPGTNFTGVSYLASALVGKRIEFLKEALPGIRRIAILARPQHPGEHRERAASEEAAGKLGLAVSYFPIKDLAEIDPAFAAIRDAKCDAVVIFPDYTMFQNRERLARLAAEAHLPAVSGWSSFAESGLLFNYGPNLRDIYRDLAQYVNRILRGAKPAELPVEFPRSIELVVNMRTARALNLKIPAAILVRADRVIE